MNRRWNAQDILGEVQKRELVEGATLNQILQFSSVIADRTRRLSIDECLELNRRNKEYNTIVKGR